MRSDTRFVGSLSLLISLIIFGVAGWMARDRAKFLETAARTNGSVFEVTGANASCSEKRGSGKYERTVYYSCTKFTAHVRFQDASGREFTMTIASGSERGHNKAPSYANHALGATIPVVYDPASPATAYEDSFFALWGGVTILSVLGLVLGITGFVSVMRGTF